MSADSSYIRTAECASARQSATGRSVCGSDTEVEAPSPLEAEGSCQTLLVLELGKIIIEIRYELKLFFN